MNFTEHDGTYGNLIHNIEQGLGPVEIVKDGKRLAVIISPEDYATLRDACLQLDVPRPGRGDWPK